MGTLVLAPNLVSRLSIFDYHLTPARPLPDKPFFRIWPVALDFAYGILHNVVGSFA